MKIKKLFSAMLATVLVFAMTCAPAFAASASEVTDALDAGSIWVDLAEYEKQEENVPFKLLHLDWSGDGVVTRQAKEKAQEFEFWRITYVPLDTTLTAGESFALNTVFVYSDPDGDGIYEERIFREDQDGVEIVSLSEPGPFVGVGDISYANFLEWGWGKDWLGLDADMSGYRTLTTNYLVEQFGADSIVEFSDGESSLYWYLTGHERSASLGDDKLENYGVSVTECGYLTSAWAKDVANEGYEMVPIFVDENHGYDLRGDITRGEFAGIAVRLYQEMSGEEIYYSDDDPFVDVEAGTDMYTYIMAARDLGIVKGTSTAAKTFEPNALVSRQDAALMLSRVFEKLGGTIPAGTTTFADNGEIGGYAMNAVAFMSSKGIINGVGNNRFDPKGNASVEQALKIALEMLNKLDV